MRHVESELLGVRRRVRDLLAHRVSCLASFNDFDFVGLYKAQVPEVHMKAAEAMRARYPTLVHQLARVNFDVGGLYARVTFKEPVPYFTQVVNVRGEVGYLLRKECEEYLRLQGEAGLAVDTLSHIARICRTIGQVYRIWPGVLGFMNPHQQERIKSQKTKSVLPPVQLPSAEGIARLDTAVAEALLLPHDWPMHPDLTERPGVGRS